MFLGVALLTEGVFVTVGAVYFEAPPQREAWAGMHGVSFLVFCNIFLGALSKIVATEFIFEQYYAKASLLGLNMTVELEQRKKQKLDAREAREAA